MVAKGDREGEDGMGAEGLGLRKVVRVGSSKRVRVRAKVGAGGEVRRTDRSRSFQQRERVWIVD